MESQVKKSTQLTRFGTGAAAAGVAANGYYSWTSFKAREQLARAILAKSGGVDCSVASDLPLRAANEVHRRFHVAR